MAAKKVSKVAAKPPAAKPAKAVTKKVAAKPATAKVVAASKPVAAKPAAAVTKPAAKPVSKVVAKTESKVKAKVAVRKAAPERDDDEDDEPREVTSLPAAQRATPNAPVLPDDLADVAASNAAAAAAAQAEPENTGSPRRKSVLEVAEEDDEFDAEPPIPTADNIDGLLDRLRKVAQFGGDALEELPRLIEQLEQIDDPAVMPRLLGLLEDNDPWGIYWNVLYVLEKFDDAYLRALLDGVEALYARAPQWTYTCVIRILNTRGDEDDCTAAFERMVQASPSRALVVQILRELANDADTDADQKANIARTITAVGGATESSPRPSE